MQSNQWTKVSELLSELEANKALFADLSETQDLMMYLVNWMNSFAHYSALMTPEQNEAVMQGLTTRLTNFRDQMKEWRQDEWTMPATKSSTDLKAFTKSLTAAKQAPEFSPTEKWVANKDKILWNYPDKL